MRTASERPRGAMVEARLPARVALARCGGKGARRARGTAREKVRGLGARNGTRAQMRMAPECPRGAMVEARLPARVALARWGEGRAERCAERRAERHGKGARIGRAEWHTGANADSSRTSTRRHGRGAPACPRGARAVGAKGRAERCAERHGKGARIGRAEWRAGANADGFQTSTRRHGRGAPACPRGARAVRGKERAKGAY
jgi:hypothetical protein